MAMCLKRTLAPLRAFASSSSPILQSNRVLAQSISYAAKLMSPQVQGRFAGTSRPLRWAEVATAFNTLESRRWQHSGSGPQPGTKFEESFKGKSGVYTSLRDVERRLLIREELETMVPRDKVFMVEPTYFDVTYVINPHMEGKIGTVDKAKCMDQWWMTREAIKKLGVPVSNIAGQKGLPDLVYVANLGLSFPVQGSPSKRPVEMYISNMCEDARKGEMPHYAEACRKFGYDVKFLPAPIDFEGQGDALWHMNRRLIWGGYGFRTHLKAFEILAREWDVPIIALRLKDPYFYHIDTCLAILAPDAAIYFPGAFDEDGVAVIKKFFPRLVEATEEDARRRLACNCFSPDGKNVVLHAGSKETNKRLRAAGFEPVEVDVSEFLKGGGSVCCMKMYTW